MALPGPISPSNQPARPSGDAAALLAGGILACSVMARGVAVHDQDRVVPGRRQGAVGFVGQFEDGKGLATFQPEIPCREDLALDFVQLRHRKSPFQRVAIPPPTRYLNQKDRRRTGARPSGNGIAERDRHDARGDGIRRGDRRRRPGRAVGGDPPEAARRRAQPRSLRLRAREGLRDRRPHPVRRRDRSDRPQRADSRLEGKGRAARDPGHRRPVPVPRPRPARTASPIS